MGDGVAEQSLCDEPPALMLKDEVVADHSDHALESQRGSVLALVSFARILLYSAASVGAGTFDAFNNFVLPPILQSFGASNLLIGLLSSTRSIEGALIQPGIGAISDQIRTPVGRRRPFMLVGIPVSAICFLAAGGAPDLVSLAIAIFLFSIFYNIAADPYAALLPDIAPLHQRGIVSGVSTAIKLISQVGFLLVIANVSANGVPVWAYGLVAAVLVVTFGVTIAGISERGQFAPERIRLPLRAYVEAITEHRDALKYLITIFVYMLGLNAILPYLVLFIKDDIHQTEQTGFALSALLLFVMALSAVVFGKLADSLGERPILAGAWAVLAVCAAAGIVVQTLPQTTVVVVLAGIGNGAATAVAWPLLTALIPPEKTGLFAGLKAAAESIAIPLSVVIASEVFLPHLGYRGIFAMLAINIIIALTLLLRFVRVPNPNGSSWQIRSSQ